MNSLNGRLLEISKLEKYELYPPFPKKNLLIEVTNKCNSNCIFCANSKMKRKRKYQWLLHYWEFRWSKVNNIFENHAD